MNIIIIAMPGCGNLGDDLISRCLIDKLQCCYEKSVIGYLCGDEINTWEVESNKQVQLVKLYYPRLNSISNWFGRRRIIADFIKTADLLFVGGGGLLQDTHSLFTPYKYLQWIKYATCPVYLVGIGVGPIRTTFNKYFIKNILNLPGIHIQVRDEESNNLLKKFGVKKKCIVSPDIVEGADLKGLESGVREENSDLRFAHANCGSESELREYGALNDSCGCHDPHDKEKILGCSLRPWKDLAIEKASGIIEKVVKEHNVDRIYFFVFENGRGNKSECNFARQVSAKLKHIWSEGMRNGGSERGSKMDSEVAIEVIVYGEDEGFMDKFSRVSLAIASRYHANILWQKMFIPVIPIPYTDKVFSLYKKHGILLHPVSSEQFSYSAERIDLTEKYELDNVVGIVTDGLTISLTIKAKIILLLAGIGSFICRIVNSIYIRI